jgi:hypothetical protein
MPGTWIDSILRRAATQTEASDLVLEPLDDGTLAVRMRIAGIYRQLDLCPADRAAASKWSVLIVTIFAAAIGTYIGIQEHLGTTYLVSIIVPIIPIAMSLSYMLSRSQRYRCPK